MAWALLILFDFGYIPLRARKFTKGVKYMSDRELSHISRILLENKSKRFVDRILRRSEYPTLDLGDGNYATHKMSWMEDGGKFRVFPTVVEDEKGGLMEMEPRKAYERALYSDDFIEFPSGEEADWFSKNYKMIWGDRQ